MPSGRACVNVAAIDLRDRRLVLGFHATERHGDQLLRWTNGEAIIELASAAFDRVMEVAVAFLFNQTGT